MPRCAVKYRGALSAILLFPCCNELQNIASADLAAPLPFVAAGPIVELAAEQQRLAGAYQALAERRFGGLDILVNNAGAAWLEKFDGFPEKGWDKVMDLNVKSPFFLTQALHGLLKAGAA